jgi:hypothetical protein
MLSLSAIRRRSQYGIPVMQMFCYSDNVWTITTSNRRLISCPVSEKKIIFACLIHNKSGTVLQHIGPTDLIKPSTLQFFDRAREGVISFLPSLFINTPNRKNLIVYLLYDIISTNAYIFIPRITIFTCIFRYKRIGRLNFYMNYP